MKDRLIRLGVPLLANILLLAPLIHCIVVNIARKKGMPFHDVIEYFIGQRIVSVGPLWFVEALLIFSIIYMAYRLLTNRFLLNFSFRPFQNNFPSNKSIVLSIIAITMGTFLVRLWFPVGAIVVRFQIGHFFHYIFCFWVGILAYRGHWLEQIPKSRSGLWGRVALVTVCCLPVMLGTAPATDMSLENFLGGPSFQSLLLSFWESIACLSIIIWLLSLFKRKFSNQSGILQHMSSNAYTVYINSSVDYYVHNGSLYPPRFTQLA